MKKILFFLFLMAVLAMTLVRNVNATPITLGWTANQGDGTVGYKIYFGYESEKYEIIIDAGNVTQRTIPLESGNVYYFVATAYNIHGTESDYSKELSIAPGGYLLWTNSAGQAKIQELDLDYEVINTYTYGPWSGYMPLSFSRDAYGVSYFLWKTTSNQADLWVMDNLDEYSSYHLYGPWNGFVPLNFQRARDGTGYFLWKTTSNIADLWIMEDGLNTYSSYHLYGPWSGFVPLNFQMGDDGIGYFLWQTTSNMADLWIMENNSLSTYSGYQLYGPLSGLVPISVNADSVDGKDYLLWKNTSNQANLWIMDNLNGYSDNRLYALAGFYPIGYFKN